MQQEVMSYLVEAVHNQELSEKLRTYSLYKNQHFFGYGIAFHTENIQPTLAEHKLVYPLVEIESHSPAEDAGMKYGQRVVAVNGEFVNKDFRSLDDVVAAIEDSYYSRNFTDITVLDPHLWNDFMENPHLAASLAQKNKVTIQQTAMPDSVSIPVKPVEHVKQQELADDRAIPRLCRLVRNARDDQYGFDFKTLKNEGKHIANNVRAGFPADRAGLRDGDYILEVNGESIDSIEHDAVVNKISAYPKQVDLLVVGDLNAYLSKQPARPTKQQLGGDEVDLDMRIPTQDVSYHRLSLMPGFKGLGISLTPNGIINAIEPNSPSDRAGLKKNYRIVQVNDIDVSDKSNKEIARLIKENESNLVIGVLKSIEEPAISRPITPAAPATPMNHIKQIVAEAIHQQAPETSQIRPYDENITMKVPSPHQSLSSASGQKISGM